MVRKLKKPKGVEFIAKAKLTRQGQLTMPQEAREKLKIKKNSDVYWYIYDGFLVVSKELMNEKILERRIRKR